MAFLNLFTVVSLVICVYGGTDDSSNSPEEHWRTCDFVKHYGYPCETRHVTTEDGYILELHRIPSGNRRNSTGQDISKPVAFLQHGVEQTSTTWVINGPNISLGFLLADRGFDVWMGNSRGNTYSDRHIILKRDSPQFWDFSFADMAMYDLPAVVDYVLGMTQQEQLYYVGHSQGTTIGFAGFSKDHILAKKIKLFVALAPVAHISHAKGLLRVLSSISPLVKLVLGLLGTKDFLPNSWITRFFAHRICGSSGLAKLCSSIVFLIAGYNTNNIDLNRLPIYLAHTPAGTSVKNMIHFSQMISSDMFQMYDYGWNGNMHRYQQPVPPSYHLAEMPVPTALFTGSLDWLSTVEDVALHLRHGLPHLVYFQLDENWNHLDFVWGKTAKTVIYDNVIELLEGKPLV